MKVRRNPVDSPPSVRKTFKSSSRVMLSLMDSIFTNVSLTHSSCFSEHEPSDNAVGLTRLEAQRATNRNITGNQKTLERLVISELHNCEISYAGYRLLMNLSSCLIPLCRGEMRGRLSGSSTSLGHRAHRFFPPRSAEQQPLARKIYAAIANTRTLSATR